MLIASDHADVSAELAVSLKPSRLLMSFPITDRTESIGGLARERERVTIAPDSGPGRAGSSHRRTAAGRFSNGFSTQGLSCNLDSVTPPGVRVAVTGPAGPS
eukprot:768225-Hanusia_phi.AAC.2